MTKEELCKIKHKTNSAKHQLTFGKHIISSKNITTSEDWENYCSKSKSDHIISCPQELLKTIEDKKVHKINRGFEKYRKKIEKNK